MSGIKPARRWQPAFFPFKKEKFSRRLLARIELLIKGPVFGCRMCGNCLLQETAFICPMECPKGLRNGPCGGVTPEGRCYVDETRKCIWNSIYERALRTGRQEKLLEVLPPLDWNLVGTETWGGVVRQIKRAGTKKFFISLLKGDEIERSKAWDSVFMTLRQPDWWEGDSEYHPAGYQEPVSELERKLRKGDFVVATEASPPLGSNPSKLIKEIELVKPYVTAVNFTDSSSAIPKMSSIACCKTANDLGAEPVLQIAARDTTRTGLQSTVIGANALGIRNILCVTGDNPVVGNTPAGSMNFVDLDSVQMIWIIRKMRDEDKYLDGRNIKYPPKLFIGASTTPFSIAPALQAIRDHKKINAGAQFFQTNIIFEPDRLDEWLEQLDKRGVLDKIFILAGIAPVKSYKIALHLHQRVPGINIPSKILQRIEKAGDGEAEEGLEIAYEMVEALKNKKGINGIHIMTLGWESAVERIVKTCGLLQNS